MATLVPRVRYASARFKHEQDCLNNNHCTHFNILSISRCIIRMPACAGLPRVESSRYDFCEIKKAAEAFSIGPSRYYVRSNR